MTGTVGIIVNPMAGKDIRRLVTHASHTPDTAKVGIVRRAVVAAADAGAIRIVLAGDHHRLASRAIADLDLDAEVGVLAGEINGSRHDTIAAARRMAEVGVDVVIVLGGDGTCRDVALGWPDAPLIAISTGTNNVFPSLIDASSAGSAAGYVATGTVPLGGLAHRTKRIYVQVEPAAGDPASAPIDDLALVDLALIDTLFTGARAVTDPSTIRLVIAAFATPMATGLSAIAGRAHPVGRCEPGGVMVRLGEGVAGGCGGAGARLVRVPIAPGSFTTVPIAEVRHVEFGESIEVLGPGVLAFDGERDRRLSAGQRAIVTVDACGPRLIDVAAVLAAAARERLFDVRADCPSDPSSQDVKGSEDADGSEDGNP